MKAKACGGVHNEIAPTIDYNALPGGPKSSRSRFKLDSHQRARELFRGCDFRARLEETDVSR